MRRSRRSRAADDTIYVSSFPPCDPAIGESAAASIERQTELVLEQVKLCPETVGAALIAGGPRAPLTRR